MKMRVFLSVILGAWVLTVGAKNIEPRFDGKKITNDVFWNTAEGMPLYSQGGGIFRYPDPDTGRLRYYWYGVRYAEAVRYREDPSVTYPACTFEAVTCYSSDDLINWTPIVNIDGSLKKLFSPRDGYFDSHLTERGPPAIYTPKGIVLLYNGKNLSGRGDKRYTANVYAAGQALFDANDPTRFITRLDEPFFRPMDSFEKSGQYVDGTVFIEGMVYFKNKWYLYYGCADSKVGVAVYDPKRPAKADPLP